MSKTQEPEEYLPIGSVVMLKGATHCVMVVGRRAHLKGKGAESAGPRSEHIWDYVGCAWPEGYAAPEAMILFDDAQVKRVFFLGMQTRQERSFSARNFARHSKRPEDDNERD